LEEAWKGTENTITITEFIQAIRRLPSDKPQKRPGAWYKTQKEHWLGWLREYHSPGAYGRTPRSSHDARFAYNHIVDHNMLLWLVDAVGVRPGLAKAARVASKSGTTMMQKSGTIRKHVPWEEVAAAFWGINAHGKKHPSTRAARGRP
jgi:hypothetical protein